MLTNTCQILVNVVKIGEVKPYYLKGNNEFLTVFSTRSPLPPIWIKFCTKYLHLMLLSICQ